MGFAGALSSGARSRDPLALPILRSLSAIRRTPRSEPGSESARRATTTTYIVPSAISSQWVHEDSMRADACGSERGALLPLPARGERSSSAQRPDRRGKPFGAVALVHVDDRFHRRRQFIDVADIGEVTLRGAAERFGRDAVEQDQAEIAIGPACRLRGVEFFPAKIELAIGALARDLPMRDDMRMLADQRQALVGMRGELEEQQRYA